MNRDIRRVVITGPTGAIGVALINQLVREGLEVLAICRRNSPRRNNIPQSPLVHVIECNLDELTSVKVNEHYDVFYHFAWEGTIGSSRNDMYMQNDNVRYTLDAVRIAKRLGCKVFIGAGSQAEYGRAEGKLAPDTPTFPETGYGFAKLCAGQMSRVLCGNLEMDHIWVRVLSVYGPYDGKMTMVMSTINKLMNNEIPQFTKGEQLWDYLYSDDAAAAFVGIAKKGRNNQIYPLGSGSVKPLSEYIEIIREVVNPSSPIDIGAIAYSQNQIMYLCADITKLVEDIGFQVKTDFKEGIQKILDVINN